MIYNLNNDVEKQQAIAYFKWLIDKKKKITLTATKKKMTENQNNYAHLIIRYFAGETGHDIPYTKYEFFKKNSPDIFVKKVSSNLGSYYRVRSFTELDTKEMSEAISRFIKFASEKAGILLPTANVNEKGQIIIDDSNREFIDHIRNEVSKFENRQYI